jgi:hypothetical protein
MRNFCIRTTRINTSVLFKTFERCILVLYGDPWLIMKIPYTKVKIHVRGIVVAWKQRTISALISRHIIFEKER